MKAFLRGVFWTALSITIVLAFMVNLAQLTRADTPAQQVPHALPTFVPDDEVGDNGVSTIQQESYRDFIDNAEAGFLQMVEIPYQSSMDTLTDEGYMEFNPRQPFETGPDGQPYVRRYAVSRLGTDARTNVGCFEAWYYQGDINSPDYGLPFCISDNVMTYLSKHGATFWGWTSY